jgi:hypothetical protein
MGYCYGRAGRVVEAQRELASLSLQLETSYVSPVSFASIYAGMNDREKALDYLDQAVAVRDPSLPIQLLGTEFDSMRTEPRLVALRQQMGLA